MLIIKEWAFCGQQEDKNFNLHLPQYLGLENVIRSGLVYYSISASGSQSTGIVVDLPIWT